MMSSGVSFKGFEEVLRNLERELGEGKVNRVVNQSLRTVSKDVEPEFRKRISAYKLTGTTLSEITMSGVLRDQGIPKIMVGFGKGSRWRLVHLQEFGYAKKGNPRGLGVIRRYSAELELSYPDKIKNKLREEFGL